METEAFDDAATLEKPAPEPINVVLRRDQKEGDGYRVEPPILLSKLSGISQKGVSTMSLGWVSPKSKYATLLGGGAAEGQSDGLEKFHHSEDPAVHEPVIGVSLGSLEHAGVTFAFEYPEGEKKQLVTKKRVAALAAAVAVALGAAVYASTGAEASGQQAQGKPEASGAH